jgi:hypothetical protein
MIFIPTVSVRWSQEISGESLENRTSGAKEGV